MQTRDRILGGPGRYIQGYDSLSRLGEFVQPLGERSIIVADDVVWGLLEETVTRSLDAAGLPTTRVRFGGECRRDEADRIVTESTKSHCEVVVGLGGGKALDTAKAVSAAMNLPVVIVPTIASNDAPTSRLIIFYDEFGALTEVDTMPQNPSVVLVDTKVAANAPVRFFVAGMGDALPTKFEAEQSRLAGFPNMFGGQPTETALLMAGACYRLIRRYGLSAKAAVEGKIVTEAVEQVIEATILLSGMGFESAGLSAAHALTRGFSAIPEMHGALHGEEVAFGLLVQFILENRSQSFLDDIYRFYRALGLPTTLADLGLTTPTPAQFQTIARRAAAPGSHIYKMTVPVDERIVTDAIRFADALGIRGDHGKKTR